MLEQLATRHKLESHVHTALVFERRMEVGNEGKLDRGKNLSLVDCVLNLLQFDDFLLLKDFEGVLVACAAVSDKQDSAEGAATKCLKQLEVLKAVWRLIL